MWRNLNTSALVFHLNIDLVADNSRQIATPHLMSRAVFATRDADSTVVGIRPPIAIRHLRRGAFGALAAKQADKV